MYVCIYAHHWCSVVGTGGDWIERVRHLSRVSYYTIEF